MDYDSCYSEFKYAYDCRTLNIIEVNDYTDDHESHVVCKNNHELIYVNRSNRCVSHFRHKNNSIISEWHVEWQNHFNNREKLFPKLQQSIKERYADVLSGDMVIEFQYSPITREEVGNRKHDYQLHAKNVIWVINGDKCIVDNLAYHNRVFITFASSWQYNSFLSYDYIFINVKDLLYEVCPNVVKSGMIDVGQPIHKAKFISQVQQKLDPFLRANMPPQSKLYIKQQGAGNGKTYGIIQKINSDEFLHYDTFILVTKQHSAKYIIYTELQYQYNEGKLINITEPEWEEKNKKFVISYIDKRTEIRKNIIIATIDSLMYTLGDHSRQGINKFENLVNSIIDGAADAKESSNFGNVYITWNKRLCLIVDETQDLHQNYGKAIVRLIRDRYIDAYIVGDKLQSINFNDNAFTYLCDNDFPFTQKVMDRKTNICRRFNNIKLISLVNESIDFNKYDLPPIEPNNTVDTIENPYEIFTRDSNSYEMDEISIIIDVEQIMTLFSKEVENNNRIPSDFLIVTPFTKMNPLVNALELRINLFWKQKYIDNNTDQQYVFFHKSEDGTSINLDESKDATRIVSIHASKGDGRKVVFVIGLSESALMKFDTSMDRGLIYESLLHVAITRMKEKLYIRLNGSIDDIYMRFKEYVSDNDSKIFKLSNKINISNLNVDNDLFLEFRERFNKDYYSIGDSQTNTVIDMKHHNVRYYVMVIHFWLRICDISSSIDAKKQIKAIFSNIPSYPIHYCESGDIKKDFENYINICKKNKYDKENDKKSNIRKIPVIKLSNRNLYDSTYYKLIIGCIGVLKIKFKTNNFNICPYESVVLFYIISITNLGILSEITIMDLYHITNNYFKAFTDDIGGHNTCVCKTFYRQTGYNGKQGNDLTQYIKSHYDDINSYRSVLKDFVGKYSNYNYLIQHHYFATNPNNSYELCDRSITVAYNNNEVLLCVVKPQVNSININEILLSSIFQAFVMMGINDVDHRNYKRFANKPITTIILTVNTFYTITWTMPDNLILSNIDFLREKIQNLIINQYIKTTKFLRGYMQQYVQFNKSCSNDDIENFCITTLCDKNKFYPEFLRDIFTLHSISNDTKITDLSNDNFNNMLVNCITRSIKKFMNFICSGIKKPF